MMKKLKEFFIQSLLIFLSVFMGVTAGNWNDDRLSKKRAKDFLEKVAVEIQQNKK